MASELLRGIVPGPLFTTYCLNISKEINLVIEAIEYVLNSFGTNSQSFPPPSLFLIIRNFRFLYLPFFFIFIISYSYSLSTFLLFIARFSSDHYLSGIKYEKTYATSNNLSLKCTYWLFFCFHILKSLSHSSFIFH